VRVITLTSRVWLPKPLEEVFPFFSDARNLEVLTPPSLGFEVLTPDPILMAQGTLIDYRLKIRGIPVRWQSEITKWNPPNSFVDEQRRGPYRLWIHEHHFEEHGGRTIAEDCVRYAVFGGRIIDTLLVRSELRRIFQYRRYKLTEIFRISANSYA